MHRLILKVTFSLLIVSFFVLSVSHTGVEQAHHTSDNLIAEAQSDTLNPETLQNDSIQPGNYLRKRLEDPNYDSRYDRGTLQPWHDIRSIYLRRTIPNNHLASL